MGTAAIYLPVFFLGGRTPFSAKSKSQAALKVWDWCAHKDGPKVPAAYCPVMERYAGCPTLGRLRKNTIQIGDEYHVGLGLPDRRQA